MSTKAACNACCDVIYACGQGHSVALYYTLVYTLYTSLLHCNKEQ